MFKEMEQGKRILLIILQVLSQAEFRANSSLLNRCIDKFVQWLAPGR
jgi:hypothetical protein